MIHPEVKRIAIGGAIGAGLAAVYLHAPHAHAEPFNDPTHQHDMAVICTQLAQNPTLQGVNSIVTWWIEQKPAAYNADSWDELGAQTMMDAVNYDCQQYAPVVYKWAHTPLTPKAPAPVAGPPVTGSIAGDHGHGNFNPKIRIDTSTTEVVS